MLSLLALTVSEDESSAILRLTWPLSGRRRRAMSPSRWFPAESRTDRAGICGSSGGGPLVWPRHWPPCYYLPLHSEVRGRETDRQTDSERERERERRGHQTHDDKHIDAGSPSLPAQHFSLNPGAKHAFGLTVGTQSAKWHQKPSSAKYHYGL